LIGVRRMQRRSEKQSECDRSDHAAEMNKARQDWPPVESSLSFADRTT
jgi:hypothetical protein